jgi:hypothetical protein
MPLFGRPGNNPYCHYRAIQLDGQGLRERVVKKTEAPRTPFAVGEFELILEPVPGRQGTEAPVAISAPQDSTGGLVQIRRKARPCEGRVPPTLRLCRACYQYIYAHEAICSHCRADVAAAAGAHAEAVMRRRTLVRHLEQALAASAASNTGTDGDPR